MNRQIIFFFLILLLPFYAGAQRFVSKEDAVRFALQNNKNVAASVLNIRQQQQLLKSSVNLPNPDIFIEAPTGNFYTPSITQSLEFPTVYGKQRQLQKQVVGLAEKEKTLSESEVKYQVQLMYLFFQYSDTLYNQLVLQDSAYLQIKNAAARQFDAGQVDYLQKTFAETQYGEIHNQVLLAKAGRDGVLAQLQYLTGIQEDWRPQILNIYNQIPAIASMLSDSSALMQSPSLQIYQQNENISAKNIELQKSKALPGLALGYFNQGEKSSSVSNRFRLGIAVPLWFWQYQANISAAKTAYRVNQEKTKGLQQQLSVQLISAGNTLTGNRQVLDYYIKTGLSKADEIIKTAQRFLQSGETDYINYLRNTNDAYNIKLRYLDAVQNYNQSIITIQYLTGSL